MDNQLRVCCNNHPPIQLERITYEYRGMQEYKQLPDGSYVYKCPYCGLLYSFRK